MRFSILCFLLFCLSCKKSTTSPSSSVLPRVLITTDINLIGGDPDDNQSLIHVLWYADELDIVGIVPDNWKKEGPDAAMTGLLKYQEDYRKGNWGKKGYPDPAMLMKRIAQNPEVAKEMIIAEGKKKRCTPVCPGLGSNDQPKGSPFRSTGNRKKSSGADHRDRA